MGGCAGVAPQAERGREPRAAGSSSTKCQMWDAVRVPPEAMPPGTGDPPAPTRGKEGGGAEQPTGPAGTGEGERAVPRPCRLRRPQPARVPAGGHLLTQ